MRGQSAWMSADNGAGPRLSCHAVIGRGPCYRNNGRWISSIIRGEDVPRYIYLYLSLAQVFREEEEEEWRGLFNRSKGSRADYIRCSLLNRSGFTRDKGIGYRVIRDSYAFEIGRL